MNKNAPRTASYWVSRIVLVFLIVTTFFPFVMLINMSLKPTVLITTDFLGLPKEPYWQNFSKALSFVGREFVPDLRRVARFHSAARFSERLCLCAASVQG